MQLADNNGMNAEPPFARFQVEHQSRRPGYASRSPTFRLVGRFRSFSISNRNFILFRSELFLHEQPDDQLDHWFLGGDCAGWIYARLLPLPNILRETDPLMEDWGWYASVKTSDTDTSIAMLVYSWPYGENCWMIGLDPRRRWLKRSSPETIRDAIDCVADGIDGIITSDTRFESFGWHELNPFDTGVTDPRE